MPGVELRPERVNGNQVRYFRPEDKEAADKVAGILGEQRVAGARAMSVGGFTVPPGQIEVWFAPPAADTTPQTPDGRPTRVDAARDRLQDAIQNSNRPGPNANRQTVRPRADRPPHPARPQQ